jgi:AraC-like DNA-binding protein
MDELLPSAAFSAAVFEPKRRFEAWHDTFGHGIARVDASTGDEAQFRADMIVQPLPDLLVARNDVGSVSLMRGRQMLSDGDDGCTFVLCLGGGADVGFGDKELKLRPGMATLVPHNLAGGMTTVDRALTFSLKLARPIATALAPDFDRRMIEPTHPSDPAVAILTAYCEQLIGLQGGVPLATAALFSAQIRELIANVLNPQSELVRGAPFGGVKAGRLQAVLNAIAADLRSGELSAASVAQRLGLTPRYVHQLMDGAGLTFSQHVRNLRLDEARTVLRQHHSDHLRISDIAYLVGFQDLSYFNREFRLRFGQSPSDIRNAR